MISQTSFRPVSTPLTAIFKAIQTGTTTESTMQRLFLPQYLFIILSSSAQLLSIIKAIHTLTIAAATRQGLRMVISPFSVWFLMTCP
jgi:hypothetical protein